MNNEQDLSMTGELFQDHNDKGLLTPKQIGSAIGMSARTGYRWFGEVVPSVADFRLVFLASKDRPEVQRRMLGYLVDETPWMITRVESSADVNQDDDVNTDDILDGAIVALGELQRVLTEAREQQKTGMRMLSPVRAESITRDINVAVANLIGVRQAVQLLTHKRSPAHVVSGV